ncbi:hypothetical protein EOM82_01910 [bacterium]|nr:hypothetical protein [bacterium]
MMNNERNCVHENESPFMTIEQRVCPKCGKVYNYEPTPIDWPRLRGNGPNSNQLTLLPNDRFKNYIVIGCDIAIGDDIKIEQEVVCG